MGFSDMTQGMGVKMLFQGQASSKPILTCELVPRSTWAKNIRTLMKPELWDIVRRKAYRAARYKCEVCSGRGPKWPVECHEKWAYHENTGKQELVKLVALCPSCHAVKHWGYSRINGKEAECRDHLAFVNGWTKEQIDFHIEEVFQQWKALSRLRWEVDMSALTQYGFSRFDLSAIYQKGGGVQEDPEGYGGPEEEPWDSIPEDCL